ncbi:hypothetical protein K4L44_01235 [Halosquirtibacter laminarini]|uniref:Uncharacterized protein n=1 Tax=Halosquirtibacter laminarini TaxID=3374600 RepID=A0AC61NFZ7_9BACT|nr:hypothetical protein K4L44_01235 [Prolixibacteraceae bacterium]
MGFADKYLKKTNNETQTLFCVDDLPETSLITIIPAFDEPEILTCLKSLAECIDPGNDVLVLVLFNAGEYATEKSIEQNRIGHDEVVCFSKSDNCPKWLTIRSGIVENIRKKKAGVGYARKTLMDTAVWLANKWEHPNLLISSLDADCLVSLNYFIELNRFAKRDNKAFYTHYFEHSIDSDVTLDGQIVDYELHLRYYSEALRSVGFPFAFHTVGSAFSVRAFAYVKQGGMNDRKAGEDFYFLHKLTPLESCGKIDSIVVYPGVRLSDRVPFGTGPMLKKGVDGDEDLSLSYPYCSFDIIKELFDQIDIFYIEHSMKTVITSPVLIDFMCSRGDFDKLAELKKNCSSLVVFRKRFFHLFDAFWILKCLNFQQSNGNIKSSTMNELSKMGLIPYKSSTLEALQILRDREKLQNK